MRRRRARRIVAAGLAVAVAAALAAVLAPRRGGSPPPKAAARAPAPRRSRHPHVRTVRLRPLADRRIGTLRQPVSDAAGVAVDARHALLAGGLDANDRSRPDVLLLSRAGDRAAGALPTAVHDTAAVAIGGAVYVFGGGTNAGTQSDAIVRLPAHGGGATVVGRLPAPSSDQAAAAIAGTAYLVGGYTGSRWLDTIVAWRPGSRPRVVAHLPSPLRYAAVTAVAGRLVIAGGSLENGTASAAVLAYRPGAAHVVRVGSLPAGTTHAAAAALGGVAYVVGGRGATSGSATGRVVAVDPRTRRVRPAGELQPARSDLAAVALGAHILLAGGLEAGGTSAALDELAVAPPPVNVYAHDRAGMLSAVARRAKPLVYVPNSQSDTVDVIDPHTFRVVRRFAVGGLPQHVVPAWDLRRLYVTNDTGNSLTPIDPVTGGPGRRPIPVDDPYNMYFTPDGRYAIVVAERLARLDFRDAHTFRLHRSLHVPCFGVDHMDFTADGRYLLASCEFSGRMVEVDVRRERVVRTISLPDGRAGMPQDVKLSPDGRIFYVADMRAGGLWEIDAHRMRVLRFLATGAGTHGLYPSRDGRLLYVSNRSEGSVSVVSFRTRKQVAKWRLPPGSSPDMGGVSADGRVLWLSGRYDGHVYAISTRSGRLLARIAVGAGPHGLCVWPQPGRYSLGHTGVLR